MSKHNFNRSFAIILGINNYENGIPALETAAADAFKLAEIIQEQHTHLKGQYQAQNKYEVQLLLNQRVTLKKLNQLIEAYELPRRIGGRGFARFRHAAGFLSPHLPKLLH